MTVVTLGCAKNSVDSEIMQNILQQNEYRMEHDPECADVIIVNTCGFIEAAKQESINMILDLSDLKDTGTLKTLIVAGCLAQRYKDELMQEIPEIDGIVGTGDFQKIHSIIMDSVAGLKPVHTGHLDVSYEEFTSFYENRQTGSSAFVKIAEGCNNFCTFCIIPQLRGEYRSRTIDSIYEETRILAKNGTKEVNLIAQDTSMYGYDIYGKAMLSELLKKLHTIEDIEWIRILYLYPGNVDDELIQTIANYPKICKYIEMPLQHSENRILKLMNRPSQQLDIRRLIDKIRQAVPDIVIRTTMIVGFPQESEEDFRQLVQFIRDVRFDRMGVFPYSLEEGTAAARLQGQIDQSIKEQRAHEIMEIQRELTEASNRRLVGTVQSVLIERVEDDHTYVGRTQYDAPEIDSEVFITSDTPLLIGDIIPIKITHVLDFDMTGEVFTC